MKTAKHAEIAGPLLVLSLGGGLTRVHVTTQRRDIKKICLACSARSAVLLGGFPFGETL